jgi:hypothetical protein
MLLNYCRKVHMWLASPEITSETPQEMYLYHNYFLVSESIACKVLASELSNYRAMYRI